MDHFVLEIVVEPCLRKTEEEEGRRSFEKME